MEDKRSNQRYLSVNVGWDEARGCSSSQSAHWGPGRAMRYTGWFGLI